MLDYIDNFLKRHGIWQLDPSVALTVTTTNDGYLAMSQAFEKTVGKYDFQVKPTECNYINHLMSNQVDAYIQTNGGDKPSHSYAFWETANDNGYDVTTTTANAFHQNGIVEHPHWTLKERIWYILYAARLGVTYWTNDLQHATWLCNHTYNSSIDMTLYQAYTSCIPVLDSLITFGTKIPAKRSGQRPNTLNPWTYDGIFLGYQNTLYNIRYWDICTGTTKTVTYDSKDEIQYADSPENRFPASEHLMKVFTGDPKTTINLSPGTIELTLKDIESNWDTIDQSIDHTPLSYTAVTAAKLNHKQHQKIIQKLRQSIQKVNHEAFKSPDIPHLKQEQEKYRHIN